MLREDMQIELDTADHEEDGDQESEADRFQLGSYCIALSTGGEESDDDAGGERTEQHVEPERLGEENKQHDEQQ